MLHTVITGPPGVGKTELGKILAEITPEGLNKAFFTLGGSEAIENAIKLASNFNIYNNIKDIIFDKKPHCYVGSDIDELELTNNIKNNIESLKNIIYDKTGSKLSDFLNICIIMNPPYKIKNIFLETVIELRREVFEIKKKEYINSVAYIDSLLFSYFILLPTASFSSVYRKKILQETQKPFLLANSKRIQFVDKGSSNLDTAWFCRSDVIGRVCEIIPLIKSNDFVD